MSLPTKTRSPLSTRRLYVELLEPRQLLYAASDFSLTPHYYELESLPLAEESIENIATSTFVDGFSSLAATPAVPVYESEPGERAKLFVDFDGRIEPSWGFWSNVTTPPFDLDGDQATFSSGELAAIQQIWSRVAEDYAPFHIDVTTIDPQSTANGTVAVVAIGGSYSDWYGSSAGGVAFVGGFTNSSSNVAYIFSKSLGGNVKYIAEATAHESGHLFGLKHQALWSGSTLVNEYNSGNSDWAPLMGIGYYAVRTTWYNGPISAAPTAFQDDMAVIAGSANGFGYKSDDHGSSAGSASALPLNGTTATVGGLIGRADDLDMWSFNTGDGNVSFQLAGASFGSNLDAVLELWNSAGAVIASAAPSTSLGASLTATLAAGSYYLIARSMGDYGDVGRYTVTGTIV